MNKHDLIRKVASESGLTQADATRAVDAIFDSIVHALKSGAEVKLSGFGTFAIADLAARVGRHPQTGAFISIRAASMPRFKPSKNLKAMLNEDGWGGPRIKSGKD